MTTTHQDWVTPNEGIEGVEGGAGDGCGVQMSEVMDASFLQRVSELSLGDGVRSLAIQENTAVAPPHWKQPLKVVQVSEDDASLMPPGWDVAGMSHQEGRYTGEILSFGWVGNTSCPCRRSWMDRRLPSPLKTVICYIGQLANHLGLRLPPPLMRSGEMWLSNLWPPRHWEFIVAYILQRVDILKSNWLLWVKIILSFSNDPVE